MNKKVIILNHELRNGKIYYNILDQSVNPPTIKCLPKDNLNHLSKEISIYDKKFLKALPKDQTKSPKKTQFRVATLKKIEPSKAIGLTPSNEDENERKNIESPKKQSQNTVHHEKTLNDYFKSNGQKTLPKSPNKSLKSNNSVRIPDNSMQTKISIQPNTAMQTNIAMQQNIPVQYAAIQQKASPYASVTQKASPYASTTQKASPYASFQQGTSPYASITQGTSPYTSFQQGTSPYATIQQGTLPYTSTTQRALPHASASPIRPSVYTSFQQGASTDTQETSLNNIIASRILASSLLKLPQQQNLPEKNSEMVIPQNVKYATIQNLYSSQHSKGDQDRLTDSFLQSNMVPFNEQNDPDSFFNELKNEKVDKKIPCTIKKNRLYDESSIIMMESEEVVNDVGSLMNERVFIDEDLLNSVSKTFVNDCIDIDGETYNS